MSVTVRRYVDADVFLRRAEAWLLRDEAEHNLILGIAAQLRASAIELTQPMYLATIEDNGDIVGCAFRTPPFKLGITRLPEHAARPLVESVAAAYDSIPAVLGPEAAVRAFAEAWCARTGVASSVNMRQRIYQLARVVPPSAPAPGELRLATMSELPLIRDWIAAFTDEANHGVPVLRDPAPKVQRGAYYVWWLDGVPRAMVGVAARTPNGARIGPVYTPPSERGRGFASVAVAQVSQLQLDDGCAFCFLYTDLANPTSNSIYQRVGYEPVCDVLDCGFA